MKTVLVTKPEADYELIDSGDGEKLERYGSVPISRPDPQALWRKMKPEEWGKAQAVFERSDAAGKLQWKIKPGTPEKWDITLAGLKFWIRPTVFKHTGVFPEQTGNWKWIEEIINEAKKHGREKITVLNLFGYTGGATMAAAKAGAGVVHVDGSKASVTWAKENAALSGLDKKPIRWIVDDARAFVKREIRRGNKYDAIIMDPPAFGRGPKGEVWKIEESLPDLLDQCSKILTLKPLFVIVNGYASGYSAQAYENNIRSLTASFGGMVESGELAIEESGTGRLLPAGIFSRWKPL